MFESILKFMQLEDKNGDWLSLEETQENKEYILQTINEWLDDGLELNGRIKGAISYLKDSAL